MITKLNKKNIKNFFTSFCPEVKDFLNKVEEKNEEDVDPILLDKKTFLIQGDCQSGKTTIIMSLAILHLLMNKCSPIIVLRNSIKDSLQLNERIMNCVSLFNESLDKKISIEPMYVGNSNKKDLKKALSGKYPKLVTTIANKSQMKFLNSVIDSVKNPQFVTLVDESDEVSYGNENVAFRILLSNVLKKSQRNYNITATTFDIIFSSDDIKPVNVVKIKPKKIYKGINQVELISLDKKALPSSGRKPLFENDENILPYLVQRGQETLYEPGCINEYQPVITLVKNTHLNECQLLLGEELTYNQDLKMWSWIVFNGKGIFLYHRGVNLSHTTLGEIPAKPAKDHIKTSKRGEFDLEIKDAVLFKGGEINKALQFFYDMWKCGEKITHIAIISGELADRSISFVSSNWKWHLSDMYYVPPKSATIANIEQASGRLCGNFDDAVPLKLYSTDTVLEKLVKAKNFQNEALERLDELESGESVKTCMGDMLFNKNKIPSGRFGTKNCNVEKVDFDDGGWGIERYNSDLEKIVRPVFEDKEEEYLYDFYLNLEKRIEMKKGIVVTRIIKHFKNIKTDNKENIMECCKFKQFHNYTQWGGNNYYKLLVKVNGDVYKLNEVVLEKIKKLLVKIYEMK
jgi:hypothetical protein